eukprot:634051-Prymnesium_polylepis.1
MCDAEAVVPRHCAAVARLIAGRRARRTAVRSGGPRGGAVGRAGGLRAGPRHHLQRHDAMGAARRGRGG